MPAFIKHTPNCSVIAERIEVSHPDLLMPAEEGYVWTEVPTPVGEWWVALSEDDEIEAVPFVRSASAQLALGKMAQHDAVKLKRDLFEHAGCATADGPIDTDPDSQRKVSGAATMALALGAAFTMDWRMADDSIVTLDATQMITVGVAVAQHVAACQARKNELDEAIVAAADLTELAAIDIEIGWPG